MKVQTGQVIGGWCVDQVLTFGIPSLVTAHRVDDPRTLATLQLSPDAAPARERHRRAAVALQALEHPRLPKWVESVHADGWVFTAFRPFSADALADRFVAGGVEWRQAVTWLASIAEALDHMHKAGWAHRNLSPQSVYVGRRDDAWLMGLEHARAIEDGPDPDLPDNAAMAYFAPEVLRDPDHDALRADLYAFGLVAYELLAGEAAFPAAAWVDRADRERQLLEWKTRAHALDPGPEQPDWLRSLVQKCTHPLPEHRLPDIETVVAFLNASKSSWVLPTPVGTPIAAPARGLPPLHVQPSYLAGSVAELRAVQRQQQRTHRKLMEFGAAGMGAVAGLVLAIIIILATELSKFA